MDSVILDIQGFPDCRGEFIVKELAVVPLASDKENNKDCSCTIFKPPYEWDLLSSECQSKIVWHTTTYHNLHWDDGDVPYEELEKIIKDHINFDVKFVYVHDRETKKWLEKFINTKIIIELPDLDCPSIGSLYNQENHFELDHPHNVTNKKSRCALKNVLLWKKWCNENSIATIEPLLEKYFIAKTLDALNVFEIFQLPSKFIRKAEFLKQQQDGRDMEWDMERK